MTPRIYTQEIHHCMFCPNVSHDKSMCMALGLNQRRAVPVHGTPDWCELPTQTPRWAAFAATVPDELYKSEPSAPSPQSDDYKKVLAEYNDAIRRFVERKKEARQ